MVEQGPSTHQTRLFSNHLLHFIPQVLLQHLYVFFCFNVTGFECLSHTICACNRGPHIVPLELKSYFLATAPIGFVHIFQLWTFPKPWTLLSSFVNCPRFECVYLHLYSHKLPLSEAEHTLSITGLSSPLSNGMDVLCTQVLVQR